MTEEEFCHYMLEKLRNQYFIDAEPYVKRLTQIAALRKSPTIVLTVEQFQQLPQSVQEMLK